MSLVTFRFNEKNSDEMHLKIESGLAIPSAAASVDHIKVDGMDGEKTLSDGTYHAVPFNVPVVLIRPPKSDLGGRLFQKVHEISNWLKSTNGRYQEFYLSSDPGYYYLASISESYDFTKFGIDYGRGILPFKLHPIKYSIDGKNALAISSTNPTLQNRTTRPAKPIIEIAGSGNITLTIGSSKLQLVNVSSPLIINSQLQTITLASNGQGAYDKMTTYPFPIIHPGRQSITWAGNVTSLKITPNWEELI
ncbi:MAG: phage tail family protein [Streptococcaceae bacterium]|jgi:phage-related protein|nr:phage tail family protein [Streptococcaceae bacterium]